MKSYKILVRAALAAGHTVSVYDGEAWAVKRSTAAATIYAAIESVGEAQLRIRTTAGDVVGWALICPGLDDDETVADYSDNAAMRAMVGDTATA